MTDLWSLIVSDAYQPFTIAFVLMLGIGLVEAIGLGIGEFPDAHLDLDGPDCGLSPLSWLGIGEGLPILIWLTTLLMSFTLVGFTGQQIITELFQSPLPAGWAVAAAIIPAIALNTILANGLARILPKEETTALHPEELLRLRGVVLNSAATRNSPSRVKVVDRYGQAHYLPIEPHEEGDVLAVGETVLLVRKEGSLFFGIADTHHSLRSI